MTTPITDAIETKRMDADIPVVFGTVPSHVARSLELDRAALMEICDRLVQLNLNGTDDSLIRFILAAHQNSATQALAAAHANFPEP